MSRRSYSRHIPDFRLITYHAENGKSIVHRMNPWTKGAMLVIVILLAVIANSVILLAALFALSVAFYAVARLPIRLLVGWYSLPLLFVLTIALLFVFTEPGKTLASMEILGRRIAISDNGLALVVTLLLRALAVVTVSLTLFMSTKYSSIAYMVSRMLPRPLANIFLLSYRFNFETSDEITDVMDAVHSRNGNLIRGVSKQTRLFAGIFGLAFIHAFERAERIAKAMEARGFSGEFPNVERQPRPSYSGYLLIAFAIIGLAVITYSRYFRDLIRWW